MQLILPPAREKGKFSGRNSVTMTFTTCHFRKKILVEGRRAILKIRTG